MSRLYCCEICDSNKPLWQVMRFGDVVTTWACDEHLGQACDRMQRDFEVTELKVTHLPKSHEWAEIRRTLETTVDPEWGNRT